MGVTKLTQPTLVEATTLASFKRAEWLDAGMAISPLADEIAVWLIKNKRFEHDGSRWVLTDLAMVDALDALDQRRNASAPSAPKEPWFRRIMRRAR